MSFKVIKEAPTIRSAEGELSAHTNYALKVELSSKSYLRRAITDSVSGIVEILSKELNKEYPDMRRSMELIMLGVHSRSLLLVPVITGNLQSSIKYEVL